MLCDIWHSSISRLDYELPCFSVQRIRIRQCAINIKQQRAVPRQHQESGLRNHMHPVSCYDIFFCDGALLIFQLPVESHMSYRGRMDMLHIIGLVDV